jgi:hypothetical protein
MKKRDPVGLAFLSFIGIVAILAACGGGGGGGGGEPPLKPLADLSISGPSSVAEYSTAAYTATATWSDNSTSAVLPAWSVNSQAMTIDAGGNLSCSQIDGDVTVTITATYASGGVTRTATMDVNVANVTTVPFASDMLSGKVFYAENSYPGGAYDTLLLHFHSDSTLWVDGMGISRGRFTGSWSIDSGGSLTTSVGGQGTVRMMLVSDSVTGLQVVVAEGTGAPSGCTLRKTMPADPAKVPGIYLTPTGGNWTFRADGTGSTSEDGGWTYTWSAAPGFLNLVFSNGYVGRFYVRADSQVTDTAYAVLNLVFEEFNPGGGFFQYYGERILTRQ